MQMDMKYPVRRETYERMNSNELRSTFVVNNMFKPGKISLTYAFIDRAVIGSAVPTDSPPDTGREQGISLSRVFHATERGRCV